MQVIHLNWQVAEKPGAESGLLMWSETAVSDQPKRDRRKKTVQPHTFHGSRADLSGIVKRLLPWHRRNLPEQSSILWLPTSKSGPVPSPELLHDWEIDEDSPKLQPWIVSGLYLDVDDAFDFLMVLHQTGQIDGNLRNGTAFKLGGDARYWQQALTLVLEVVAQQKLRPMMVEIRGKREPHYEARWQPILDSESDAQRLTQLADMMPSACRAVAPNPEETIPPRAILDNFLNHITDTAARRWGQEKELYLPTDNNPAERWLRALFAIKPEVTGSQAQLQHLYSSYRAWERTLTIAGDRHFRVAFRLEAPRLESESDQWHLHYLLQARDDASLIVPADAVWQAGSGVMEALGRRFERPQERLLTGLGYAGRFFAPIERSLHSQNPGGISLSPPEAFEFLRHCAPQLEQSGFGILTPPWWNKPGTRLGVRLSLGSSGKMKGETAVSSGHMSLSNLVEYKWKLSIGDTELTRDEFNALVALKSPLVQIRGQWVQLDPEQIEAAIQFWKKQKSLEGEISLHEAMQLGLGGEDSHNGLPIDGVNMDEWLQTWLDKLQGDEKLELLPPPTDLNATLRPYQQYGYSWLDFTRRWGMGGILADDMGLGKCVSADTSIVVNGMPLTAENIWQEFSQDEQFDGEGYWTEPVKSLTVNAIDETTGKMTLATIHKLYRQPIQENVRQITLEDGSSITITRQHKLLTSTGWRNNLEVGDYVCVPNKLIWQGSEADADLVQFLAWQIAEGHERPDVAVVRISQKEKQCLTELYVLFQQVGKRYGLEINQPSIKSYEGKVPFLRINSVAYRKFLEEKGYVWGQLSAQKMIPPFIMQANNEMIRIFLRHFFEAEGSVSLKMRTVEISSASEVLITQLSILLRRFGIWLRTSSKQKCATNGSGIYRTYYFGVFGGNSARLFEQEIGFVSQRKQAKLQTICKVAVNTNIEGIPASHLVADLVVKSELPLRHLGMYNTVYVDGSQEFSEHSLAKVIHDLDLVISGESERTYRQKKRSKWTEKTLSAYADLDNDFLQETRESLQGLIDQEVFYCRIKSIEDIFYEGWVYDFEVMDHHNFVANQIICHNTIQTLTMVQRLKTESGKLSAPILLICPTSVVTNWQLESEKFTPNLVTMAHQGGDRLREDAFIAAAQEVDIVLTSYALVRRDGDTMQKINWLGVVLDEAQNIKNASTKQAQTIRKLSANFRLALTGTPVENRLSELWSIMHFLNPGYLGSQKKFRQNFVLPIEKYGDDAAIKKLRKLTRPFILRRLKTDPTVITDLPDKQEVKVYCHLSEEQATLYQAVVADAIDNIEAQQESGMARKGLVLSMLMQLKQICNHPVQYLHQGETYNPFEDNNRSGKLHRFHAILDEVLAEGDKLLLFTQFTEMGDLLKQYIQDRFGVQTLYLHGGVRPKKRAELVKHFQTDDGPPVFILSLKAGGTGLNLTHANHVFHFDRWWNPAVEDQATDRAFRIGQTKNVLVHKFVCLGTLEERIDQMLEEKKALADSVIGGGENWLTEMSTSDLRELVRLRH